MWCVRGVCVSHNCGHCSGLPPSVQKPDQNNLELAPAGPSDPAPTGLAYQLLNAGELLALCAGQRGMVMVQVCGCWHMWLPGMNENCLVWCVHANMFPA